MYDVIIVGSRIAGSSLAIQLGRAGAKVLLVDRVQFPKDTLSTHFLWPRGVTYLNRLGVLDELLKSTPSSRTIELEIEGMKFAGSVPEQDLRDRFRTIHGNDHAVTQLSLSARRTVLDSLLVNHALQVAEVKTGVTINSLLTESGRVVGVTGNDSVGNPFEAKGKLVVGADGKRSTVAKQLCVPEAEVRPTCTFAAYSYFSGLTDTHARILRKGRLGVGLVPTNNGAHMVLAYGPKEYFTAFREDTEGNFFKTIRSVDPVLAEALAQANRQEPFYSTADQAAFIRKAHGPGFILCGDAASFKDQCTASGMTHALRDAELATEEILSGLRGDKSLDAAGKDYAARRHLDSYRYYDFVCAQAEMAPPRAEEMSLYRAIQGDAAETNRLISTFGDTYPVKKFFAGGRVRALISRLEKQTFDRKGHEVRTKAAYRNPYLETPQESETEFLAMNRTCVDFAQPIGHDLLGRTEEYYEWYSARQEMETFQYSRTLRTFPRSRTTLVDDLGRSLTGINFASQDYLALGEHPDVHRVAMEALREFGPHSAGSPMVIGNTSLSQKLEEEISKFLGMNHTVLFPTGFAAGFGVITGLVRPHDHIVMDRLAHACLQQGARAATSKIHRHPHLDVESCETVLRQIRATDKRNAILVVSEGIFSMDSDTPDLKRLQQVCRVYGATLLVDVAHDLGALGKRGLGELGDQNVLDDVDLVMGSFSKTFAANGGFVSTRHASVKHFLKMYSNAHLFSNALSPVQSAVALKAFQIVQNADGAERRAKLLAVSTHLRSELAREGLECLGIPSAIVPVMIGDERTARLSHKRMRAKGVAAMILEYPVVAAGSARFRLQVMASHTKEEATFTARAIGEAVREAKAENEGVKKGRRVAPPSPKSEFASHAQPERTHLSV